LSLAALSRCYFSQAFLLIAALRPFLIASLTLGKPDLLKTLATPLSKPERQSSARFFHVRSEKKFIADPKSPTFALTCWISKTIMVIGYRLQAQSEESTRDPITLAVHYA
jgi:hypothetical protein